VVVRAEMLNVTKTAGAVGIVRLCRGIVRFMVKLPANLPLQGTAALEFDITLTRAT